MPQFTLRRSQSDRVEMFSHVTRLRFFTTYELLPELRSITANHSLAGK